MGMKFDHEITCIDRDGNPNQFKYSLEKSERGGMVEWTFRVMPFDSAVNDWFEFVVTVISSTVGKVTMMTNNNMAEYKGKGIPEKMIEEAAHVLKLTIISSTNKSVKKLPPSEFRTIAATKVWERLREKGQALYDEEEDIYTFKN